MRNEYDRLAEVIIGAAIDVHKELGPGLLENTYESCLFFELIQRGFTVSRQREQPVKYKGHVIECGYRLDLLVNNMVVVELKSVEKLERIHEAQLLTYLKLSGLRLGFLMNFNCVRLVDGIKRMVMGSLD